MPIVQRHPQIEEWVYEAARRYLAKRPRTGIHVSDLISPRKAFWARVMPKETTDRNVLYFMAGRAHEDIFIALAGLGQYRKVRGEWSGIAEDPYPEGEGVRYEIDALVPNEGGEEVPAEFKTNRRSTVIEPSRVIEEYSHYLDQLGRYCAIRDRRISYLIVLHLMARNLALKEEAPEREEGDEQTTPEVEDAYGWLKESKPVLVVYQIDWTEEELEAIRQSMSTGRRVLEAAVESKDHTILPECAPWMCGKPHSRSSAPKCPNCGVVQENRRLKKCPTCGTKKERVDLVREVETVFVPSCAWWSVCLPGQWKPYHTNFYRPRRDDE